MTTFLTPTERKQLDLEYAQELVAFIPTLNNIYQKTKDPKAAELIVDMMDEYKTIKRVYNL